MKKESIWYCFIGFSSLILLQGNFGIPSLDGKIWPLLGIVFFAYKSIESILRRHLTSAVLQVYWRSSLQITLMTCYQLPIILLFGLASWWYLVLVI